MNGSGKDRGDKIADMLLWSGIIGISIAFASLIGIIIYFILQSPKCN